MASQSADIVSPALQDALERFSEFLVSDDAERSALVEKADDAMLRELVVAVTPLYEEINSTLDALVKREHPLPDDAALLEDQLNSLGQVGMEAQFELEARGQ